MKSLQEVKKAILEMGGVIIQKPGASSYFSYMLDGGFGYVQDGNLSGCLHLSSEHKPNRYMGTGSMYQEKFKYTKKDIRAATTTLIGSNWIETVQWYKGLKDYLSKCWYSPEIITRDAVFKFQDGELVVTKANFDTEKFPEKLEKLKEDLMKI